MTVVTMQPGQYPPRRPGQQVPPPMPGQWGPPPGPHPWGPPRGYVPPPQPVYEAPVQRARANVAAHASIFAAILGLFVFGFLLGPFAIITGIIGIVQANTEGRPNRGSAIAGLCLGVVDGLLGLYLLAG